MLKVVGPDPGAIDRRLRHHAVNLLPIVDALVYGIIFHSGLTRDDKVHVIKQSKVGASSFSLHLADGRELHFRPHGGNRIVVYDRYFHHYDAAHTVAVLRTAEEARRWARRLDAAAVAA